MIRLLAQSDPLGGWGGLILQGGAFMLLVYIVTVMYPRAAIEARSERESRDKAFRDERDLQGKMFSLSIETLNTNFEARNSQIVKSINEQTVTLSDDLESHTQSIERAMGLICKSVNHQ